MRLAMKQGVVGAGIALAFVALWTQIYPIRYYTDDGSSLGYLLILLVLSSLLLSTSILLWRERSLWLASAAGLALLGYYICYPLIITVGGYKDMSLGDLKLGGWLGMIGATLIALGGAPVYARRAWSLARRRRRLPFLGALLAGAAGFGLLIAALFLHLFTAFNGVTNVTLSYWNDSSETHPLALLLIVLSGIGLVAIAVTVFRRVDGVRLLTLAAALMALGVTLFWPLLFAFNGLGHLQVGGWLALGGAALATLAAVAALLLDAPAEGAARAPASPVFRAGESARPPRKRRFR